jgi:hypothetical protein
MDNNILNKNSYVTFDATSLRDLIVDRLNRGKVFTDQNYQGSNLSSFIDIISYTFSTLLYYLNKTSSESMFSEAQLYENMNRVVKLLNYSPVGRLGQSVPYKISATNLLAESNYTIPRYSYVSTGGETYSINQDITFTKFTSGDEVIENIANTYLAYQGIYQEYPIYNASGVENEVIYLSLADNVYVDHFNIDVYVKYNETNSWVKWDRSSELFLYKSNDKVFEARFNENKRYEIRFGDDINGKKLNEGDQVLIYFLLVKDSGVGIGPGGLNNSIVVPFNSVNYTQVIKDTATIYENFLNSDQSKQIKLNNDYPSTLFSPEENVDAIRKNAPKTFRSQYRLVTASDYESYLQTNYSNFLADLKIVSNENFLKNYIKYLYDIGLNEPQKENRILFNQIKFSTSCNFNNLYVYMVPKSDMQDYLTPPQKEIILNGLEDSKTLTSNIVPMDPVYVYIDFYVKKINGIISPTDISDIKLKITKTQNNKRADSAIKSDVEKIFKTYFDRSVNKIGQMIDIYQLATDILNIDGVDKIETHRISDNYSIEGLSFIFWNSVYPEQDSQVTSQNIQLENFKYPIFNNLKNIFSKIEIIEKTNSIKAADF